MSQLEFLEKFISELYPLKEEELEIFLSVWEPFTAKRKMILTHAGDTKME